MKRLIRSSSIQDMLSFAVKECLKQKTGYAMSICDEGILVHRANIYEDVDIKSKYLSDTDCKFIFNCFSRAVNVVYSNIEKGYVAAAGKKITPRQKAKQDELALDDLKKGLSKESDESSTEFNPYPEYPYRRARTLLSEGGASVCMLLKLDFTQAKKAISEGLDVYAFNADDAKALFREPILHDIGEDGTQAPHYHENKPEHTRGKPHAFYGKIIPERNLQRE